MMMDARRLGFLIAVIERGSINGGAIASRISQPAMTKAIRQLEQGLGVTLLERRRDGVAPTPYGRALYTHAKAVLSEIADAAASIRRLKGLSQERVSVGGLGSVVTAVLAPAVAALGRDHPQVTVHVVELSTKDCFEALRQGEIDFGVVMMSGDVLEAGLSATVLLREPLAIIARFGHPLALRPSIGLADLIRFPWVLPARDGLQRRLVEEMFHNAGLPIVEPRVECNGVQFTKVLVASTDYIGLVPPYAVRDEIARHAIYRVPLRPRALQRRLAIYWRGNHPLSPACRALMRAVQAECRGRRP